MALNKVLLIGNVGKDPEVRQLENGTVASFSLATTERYKDRELTEWHNIVAWRQLADLVRDYVHKGMQIYVEGRIRTRSWDDQNGQKHYVTEIQADSIQFLGKKEPAGQESPQAQRSAARPEPAPKKPSVRDYDDLPF